MTASTIRRTKRTVKNRFNATEPEHELIDHATGQVHKKLTLAEARGLQVRIHQRDTREA